MSDSCQFVCTLTPAEETRRRAQDASLAKRLTEIPVREPRRAVLAFPRDAEPGVRDFVREESGCCSFFAFDVQERGSSVLLEVSAPAGAEHMLERLVEHFEAPPRARGS